MDKLKYIKLENEDGSYSDSIPLSVNSDYVDIESKEENISLSDYINNNDINIHNLQNETSGLNNKIDANTSAIQGLASGSPKGNYATVETLISANPDTGVYIVTGNGHIYSWTKNQTGDPIDLGVYQSRGVGINSIEYEHLYNKLKNGLKLKDVEILNPVANKIINTENVEYNYNNYSHSEPILLKSGETIYMETKSNTQYLAPICITDEQGTQFHHQGGAIVDTTNYNQYSYRTPYDCYIILSYKTDSLKNVYIATDVKLTDLSYNYSFYDENQHNLITDTQFQTQNATISLVNTPDDYIKKQLNVVINYNNNPSGSSNKYQILKTIPKSANRTMRKFTVFINIKKNSGDDAYLTLDIINKNYNAMCLPLDFVVNHTDYKTYMVSGYLTSNYTDSIMYLRIYEKTTKHTEITSVSANLNIRAFGIVYDKQVNNSIFELMTPYDYVFNFKNLIESSQYKNISILGDSYSTYGDWLPNSYEAWYADSGNIKTNNVNDVSQTWWYKLLKDTKSSLLVNCSYSGSTICNTGYNGGDSSATSFITRMKTWIGEQRKTDTKLNLIIIMGGTNDYWAGSPIGELKYSGWTSDDLKSVLPAFCYMLDYLKKWNPGAKIINVVNTEIGTAIPTGMAAACKHYGITNVTLASITKESEHPNQTGMAEIEAAILSVL